jgi:hypothetical protein
MDFTEFVQRFSEQQEIGRDLTDDQLSIFFDNGREVGLWREDRRTTIGRGEVLGAEAAELARFWFAKQKAERDRSRSAGPSR